MSNEPLMAAVRRYWLLVVVAVVLGLVAAAAFVRLTPPRYSARSDIYVSMSNVNDPAELSAAATFAQAQARNFSVIATRQRVLDPVIRQLGLQTTPDSLAQDVSATAAANTSVITIEATSGSPQEAAAVANAVGDVLSSTATDLLPAPGRGAASISLQVVQRAAAPTEPSSPNLPASFAVGGVAGLVLGVLLASLASSAREGRRLRAARRADDPHPGGAVDQPGSSTSATPQPQA